MDDDTRREIVAGLVRLGVLAVGLTITLLVAALERRVTSPDWHPIEALRRWWRRANEPYPVPEPIEPTDAQIADMMAAVRAIQSEGEAP